MMKTYVNKEGYEIHATEKSYRLFYEKMGFIEKKENQEEDNKDITKMSVKQLKAYCDEKGITYEPDAKKNDLLSIIQEAENESDDSKNQGNASGDPLAGTGGGEE